MRCLVHRWRIVLVLALLLSAALGAAGSEADAPANIAGAPEPFPFTDRYPAEVSLAAPGDLAVLVRLGIDVAKVEALDGSYPQDIMPPLRRQVPMVPGASTRAGPRRRQCRRRPAEPASAAAHRVSRHPQTALCQWRMRAATRSPR